MGQAQRLRPDLYFPPHEKTQGGITQERIQELAFEALRRENQAEAYFAAALVVAHDPGLALPNARYFLEPLLRPEELIIDDTAVSHILARNKQGDACLSDLLVSQLLGQEAQLIEPVKRYACNLDEETRTRFMETPLLQPGQEGYGFDKEWVTIQTEYNPEKERKRLHSQQQESLDQERDRKPHPFQRKAPDIPEAPPLSLWARIRQYILWFSVMGIVALGMRTLGCQKQFFGW